MQYYTPFTPVMMVLVFLLHACLCFVVWFDSGGVYLQLVWIYILDPINFS